jgi:hypothetical protein
LRKWHDFPDLPTTSKPSPAVMFVDQQRRPGRRLHAYAVLGESESESGRRFLVKLSLAEPDESLLVAYYVFGQDPIWVYRSEDFDMIMHWEHPMPTDPPVPADPPNSEDTKKAKPEQHDHTPRTEAAGNKTGSARVSLLSPLVVEQQAESFGDGLGPDIAAQRREVAVAK